LSSRVGSQYCKMAVRGPAQREISSFRAPFGAPPEEFRSAPSVDRLTPTLVFTGEGLLERRHFMAGHQHAVMSAPPATTKNQAGRSGKTLLPLKYYLAGLEAPIAVSAFLSASVEPEVGGVDIASAAF
jgi:hypothetical protein